MSELAADGVPVAVTCRVHIQIGQGVMADVNEPKVWAGGVRGDERVPGWRSTPRREAS